MVWTAGILLVVLAIGQVPAELVAPTYFEDVIAKAGSADSSRIVSGWEAVPGQLPHQVSLRLVGPDGGVSGCGGSLVHRSWVISAAHCTAGRVTAVVRAGVVSLTTPQYMFETTDWWNHPTFDESRPAVVQPNDIAIIKLQRAVTYTNELQRIRIQPSTDAFRNYANEVLIASGWGRLWTNGAQPEVLNWVYLRGMANLDCSWIYGAGLINSNAICARFFNVTSQSICQGDSGGPLMHLDRDGVPVLVGVASFVAGGDFGCHSEHPGGFIRPGPFIPWFNEVTGLDFDNLIEEDDEPEAPATTVSPTTEDSQPSTEAATTNQPLPTTTSPITQAPEPEPEPEEEEEEDSDSDSDESDDSSEEDPELSELLKKLIVKVKVKVKINNKVKRKIKVKCVDKF